jgi:aspartyl-tRNA(Asn)/glutamyl-tRNA(Gln) amidotransferase subunit A
LKPLEPKVPFENTADWTIARTARLLRARKLSPVELAREMLDRIEREQPRLRAFITVTPELALDAAKRAEREISRSKHRGPLHGIPISIKDIFWTRGVRTTSGSRLEERFVPRVDAAVVERLHGAGAVVLGKNNMHEWAYGVTSNNPYFGTVRNPWDTERVPGGSSGGSAAAVAAGLGLASLGSDTGGSIRIPASVCGIVGLKPTLGRVPLHGVTPLAWSLDTVGPLCRSVEDAALFLEVVAGADPRDPNAFGEPGESFSGGLRRGIKRLRVGVPKERFFDRLQSDVRRAVLAALTVLEGQGAELREISLPMLGDTDRLAGDITVSEAYAFHQKRLEETPEAYGADVRERMLSCAALPAAVYIRAQQERREYTRAFAAVFEEVQVVAAPTLPVVAPRIDETEVAIGRSSENVRLALIRFTRASNLTGFPVVSVPCGFSSSSLPVGLQLIGPPRAESVILRAAYAYEAATPWHEKFPPS